MSDDLFFARCLASVLGVCRCRITPLLTPTMDMAARRTDEQIKRVAKAN